MSDVITRFKLETTQYDSKLRDSSKALAAYAKQTEAAGKDFTNFSQNAVNAAKALGQVASGATNTKDKLRDLVGAYNDVAKAYNKLSEVQRQTDFGKNMAASLEQLQTRIKETKQELYSLGDAVKSKGEGGSIMGGALSVFGGNLMTKGFDLVANTASNFVNTIKEAAAQGIEMAKAGEGVRLAFERLNQPGLLDNLREATHGTVTNLELMKAAVKFSDFKLPLDQLGTMLAFAQQKAKDTGQSIDYLVDSIVTGLGRKSLMILDNLGLSAAEIKEKMAETGDMTKAVGEIIRDQMAKAGEYTSTAADRATAAQVNLQNAMEEFGRTLLPLQEQGVTFWNELEIGAIKFLNNGLKEVTPGVIALKDEISDLYDVAVNNPWTTGFLDWLETGLDISTRFLPYISKIRQVLDAIKGAGGYQMDGSIGGLIQGSIKTDTIFDIPEFVINGTRRPKRGTGATVKMPTFDDFTKQNIKTNQYLEQNLGKALPEKVMPSVFALLSQNDKGFRDLLGISAKQWDYKKDITEKDYRKLPGYKKDEGSDLDKFNKDFSKVTSGVGSIVSGIQSMGIELPQELQSIFGVLQGVSSIMSGISVMLALIHVDTTAISAQEATQTFASFVPGMARGGIIPRAANGYFVPGNNFSGDVTPVLANAGELILNRAAQGTIANALEGGGTRNIHVSGTLRGTDLVIAIDRALQATGRGELVTWGK